MDHLRQGWGKLRDSSSWVSLSVKIFIVIFCRNVGLMVNTLSRKKENKKRHHVCINIRVVRVIFIFKSRVCVCVCLCVCMLCICVCMCVCVFLFVCMSACALACVCVCACLCISFSAPLSVWGRIVFQIPPEAFFSVAECYNHWEIIKSACPQTHPNMLVTLTTVISCIRRHYICMSNTFDCLLSSIASPFELGCLNVSEFKVVLLFSLMIGPVNDKGQIDTSDRHLRSSSWHLHALTP